MKMPLVACASLGGQYDDAAFVAGYECGILDTRLERLASGGHPGNALEAVMPVGLVEQCDLLAMRYGCVMHPGPERDGEIVLTFVRTK